MGSSRYNPDAIERANPYKGEPGGRPKEMGQAKELLKATLGSDPWVKIERLRSIGDDLAEAEALVTRLEAETKSLKARLQTEYAVSHASEALTEAKLERLALGSEAYATHIRAIAVAVERHGKVKNEYWTLKASLEMDRAAVAHQNQLMRLGGEG